MTRHRLSGSAPRRGLLPVLAALVALLTLAIPDARAQGTDGTGPWFDTDQGSVRLIAAVDKVGEGETLKLGLEFQLQPGWKIYWRSPGDAGFPPRPDWSDSRNVAATEIAWPAPERFTIFEMQTFGYGDEVVLPITLTPERPGEAVRLAGTVNYLTCKDICIPYDAALSIDLPAGAAHGTPGAHLIDKYRAAVPVKQRGGAADTPGGLSIESARIAPATPTGDTVQGPHRPALTLRVAARSTTDFDDTPMELLVEGPAGSWFGRADTRIDPGGHGARLSIPGGGATAEALADQPLTLTLIDGARAVEAVLTPTPGGEEASPGERFLDAIEPTSGEASAVPPPSLGFWTVIGFALIGGLILNLMPCVLPVLSLKLMGAVSKSGATRQEVRFGFLASAAGIIVSFLVLAVAAIAVKTAGLTVGWGIQFQQPVFLAFMVALLVLFTCNLLGLFEFRLPGAVTDHAARAGQGRGYSGDFVTGAFATLLATPCSAPFLGTAVGFALSRGAEEILAVFLTLGIGLAAPYLAVAAMPGIARLLPRPGPWMIWLRRVLALALVGTALWLLDILRMTIGAESAAAIGMMAGLAGIVLGAKRVQGSRLARFAWPLSAVLAFLTVIYPLTIGHGVRGDMPATAGQADGAGDDRIEWIAFDRAAIADHVAAGRTVFVDVTADWCVTCQWNKKTVVERGTVAEWLSGPEVVAMRADWTRPDPAIADYLASFGRYGIPFNAVYGPDAPSGVTLPELLSETDVLEAAAAAGADPLLAGR
ncbi:thioredoxin family protein [Marivibrio halodurans]|uniref:Thioredoxin family protein n=1 Tax=Marivibrio halodurans TaxID=2039722 RepID=A0A8J7V3T7_9PROT|nr:protein-disulfide reductase DsbD domain-containing protein [Marivibrio halodurans]MBP5858342.1 thioredoxin family protein [Marivibrio halodurans]